MGGWAIIVTGVAGVGKTQIGSRLAEILGLEFVDVPRLVEEKKAYERYDTHAKEYVVDMRRISFLLGSLMRGRRCVISSTYPIKPRGLPVRLAVVVRLRPDVLMKVLVERKYPEWKIAENISAELIDRPLHEAITKYGKGKVLQVDSTGRDLDRLSVEIADAIRSRRVKSVNTKVDWIGELERSGGLEEVLSFLARFQRR